jgi:hypothetical protein
MFGEDVTERLEVIPRQWKVIQTRARMFAPENVALMRSEALATLPLPWRWPRPTSRYSAAAAASSAWQLP